MNTQQMLYAIIFILVCFFIFLYNINKTQNKINVNLEKIASQLEIDIIDITY
jgi:preprotein translocase subunit YajC